MKAIQQSDQMNNIQVAFVLLKFIIMGLLRVIAYLIFLMIIMWIIAGILYLIAHVLGI